MKLIPILLFSFFLLMFFQFGAVYANVVINEFESFTSDDWVEIYSFEDTDISGWIIQDSKSNVATVSAGTKIGPSTNPYYVFGAGNRLNKDGDTIKLLRQDLTLVDSLSYGGQGQVCAPGEGQSVGRYPDANNTIERFSAPSKGLSNNQTTILPCPVPTQEPVATATQAPTNTPSPVLTLRPTATRTPTKTVTPSVIEDDDDQSEHILGTTDVTTKQIEPEASESGKKKNLPILPTIFIVSGMVCLGFPVVVFLKRKRSARINS